MFGDIDPNKKKEEEEEVIVSHVTFQTDLMKLM